MYIETDSRIGIENCLIRPFRALNFNLPICNSQRLLGKPVCKGEVAETSGPRYLGFFCQFGHLTYLWSTRLYVVGGSQRLFAPVFSIAGTVVLEQFCKWCIYIGSV